MKNIPKQIFLQVDSNGERPEEFDPDNSEYTWCREEIYTTDLSFSSIQQFELKELDEALRVFLLYRKKGGQPETAMDRRLQKAKAITEKYLTTD